jgi:dTDP-4-dehydrorhamnose reductase
MKKIVVIGSKGQLGNELQDLSGQYDYEFFFYDKEELDITQQDEVEKKIQELQPQFLINCAAYTAVDKAETDKEICYAINADAVGYLAKACKNNNTQFIHISTDYVFDGTAAEPYKETDKPNPQSIYGKSKLAGEQEAVNNNPEAIIIRTSWVYSVYGSNFVKTMLRLMQSRPELNVVSDQYGSPTYAADLAQAIMHIVESQSWQPGIYHYSNEGIISWFDFAKAIRDIAQLNCVVNPISTEQYPTPAARPKYSVLDKTKMQQTFGIELKDWKDSLQECLGKLAVE